MKEKNYPRMCQVHLILKRFPSQKNKFYFILLPSKTKKTFKKVFYFLTICKNLLRHSLFYNYYPWILLVSAHLI